MSEEQITPRPQENGRKTNCPKCGRGYESTRAALACWLLQERGLLNRQTLEGMGRRLGVTRERVRQLLQALGVQRKPRRRQPQYHGAISRPAARTYRTEYSPERRDKWRIYQRERYRNDPEVRAAAKRRYDTRWANEPEFREAHRRRARNRYWLMKARATQADKGTVAT